MNRVDVPRNMARFYAVDVQPDLLGGQLVTRYWGRIGTLGQCKKTWCPDEESAQSLAEKMASAKLRRGYLTVSR